MADHAEAARKLLSDALGDHDEAEPIDPWLHIAAAGIHAILHVADTIGHGLRDIVYEIRD